MQCQNKKLERDNCNMLNTYFIIDKHSMFDCKPAISIKLLQQTCTSKSEAEYQFKLRKHKDVIMSLLTRLEYLSTKAEENQKRIESMSEEQQQLI